MIDVARRAITTRARTLGVALAAAAAVYAVAGDPHRSHRYVPRCPVKLLTGLDCPACGGLRLSSDLVHVDLPAAMHDNAFLLLCSPILAALAWRGLSSSSHARPEPVPPHVAYALGSAALLWMVVRNHPRWPLKPIVRR